MSKTILFSPIGGTDPISNDRDGSLLHICRIYRPDKVIMFMSKEICEFHKKDNRYVYCLEKLGELMNHKFEYDFIMEPELSNVHDYNYFYRRFREEIEKVCVQEANCSDSDEKSTGGIKILLNTSSGTPAMKSALHVIATISENKYIPLQVSTPERKMNPHRENKNEYDVENYWESNFDNLEECFENRCEEIECENLTVLLKRNMICKFIEAYDYNAALMIADEIKDDLSEQAYKMIAAAAARLQLDLRKYSSYMNKVNGYDFMPVKSGNQRKLIEYLLSLEMKIKKGELADFLRGITPVIADLFEEILKAQYSIKISDYTCDNNSARWDDEKLKKEAPELYDILSESYAKEFNGGNVASDHIAKLIKALPGGSVKMKNCISELREVEIAVRNTAAHEIVSITEDVIKTKTRNIHGGLDSKGIFKLLKEACSYADLPGGDKVWKSYDDMNKIILENM